MWCGRTFDDRLTTSGVHPMIRFKIAAVLILACSLYGAGVWSGRTLFRSRSPVPVQLVPYDEPKKSAETGPLTPEQEIAFAKLCRDYRGKQLIVVLPSGSNHWWIASSDGTFPGFDRMPSRPAIATADDDSIRFRAESPNTAAVAVLDLCAAGGPKVAKWHYDDGKGVKAMSDAPTPELAERLRRCIEDIRRGR